MRYAKGVMWLDDCRIPFVDEGDNNTTRERYDTVGYGSKMSNGWGSMDDTAKQGRFTPNLLVCDDMLNDGSVSNSTGGIPNGKSVYGRTSYNESSTINTQTKVGFGDKGSNSRYYDLDKLFDKIIDEIQ